MTQTTSSLKERLRLQANQMTILPEHSLMLEAADEMQSNDDFWFKISCGGIIIGTIGLIWKMLS